MRGLLAVVRLELERRWVYPALALAVGLLALAAPLLPGAAGQPPDDVREAAASALFWLVSVVFGVLLGASLFGTDLAEQRLGFFFSRPIRGWALWGGRAGAAAVLLAASAALVLLPAALVAQQAPRFTLFWSGGPLGLELGAGQWLVVPLVLMPGAHALRSLALARSRWSLGSAAAVLGVGMAVWWLGRGLFNDWALGPLAVAAGVLEIAVVVALVGGSAAQIMVGRASVERGQRALALVLWGVLLPATAGFAGWSAWVRGAGPGDLLSAPTVMPAPAGDWLVVSGPARRRAGYRPAFLLRPGPAEAIRLPAGDPFLAAAIGRPLPGFSADGSTAYWVRPEGHPFASPLELVVARLDASPPRPRPLGLFVGAAERLALSADGSRLARLASGLLTVEELARPDRSFARRAPDAGPDGEIWFGPGGGSLFVLERGCSPRCRVALHRVPLPEGEAETWLEIQGQAVWSRSAAGDRAVVSVVDPEAVPRLVTVDLVGGARAELPLPDGAGWIGRPLAGGGLLLQAAEEGARLMVADADGRRLLALSPVGGSLRVGGQPTPQSLLVVHSPTLRAGRGADWTLYRVDLETGDARPLGEDLWPVADLGQEPGSLGSRLLRDFSRRLYELDPGSLEVRLLLGAG